MMDSIVRFVHDKFYMLIVLLIAGGFAVIVAELIWTNHTDGIQLVGMIAAVAGVVLGLAALFVKGTGRLVVAALFLVLSVSGIIGVVEHREATRWGRGRTSSPAESFRRVPTRFVSTR